MPKLFLDKPTPDEPKLHISLARKESKVALMATDLNTGNPWCLLTLAPDGTIELAEHINIPGFTTDNLGRLLVKNK